MRGQALSAPRVAAVSALAVALVAAGVFLYRAKRRKYVYEPPHRMNSTEAPVSSLFVGDDLRYHVCANAPFHSSR
jgi:hypothetical protein